MPDQLAIERQQASSNTNCHADIITIKDIAFSYESQQVMEKVSFSVQQRDFTGLIGSNGAGKTTLLRMIVGLLKPASGSISLFGTPIAQFKDWHRIGYVPQKNSFNPLFPATVREVVLSGLYGRNKQFRRLTKADQTKADEALHAMGIEDLAAKRIGQLSGGQQQRVFLARALINNPELLILDEPTVGIDSETQAGFFHLIKHMHQHHHMTFLMVSHDMDMIRGYLGEKPARECGKLKFYVRHSHDAEDCGETNIAHGLQGLREVLEREKEGVTIGNLNN
ncbi:metal ABC transporter ATP-binding protein [Paenibacillus sp. MMS18-CY102]|uniref:metal ABC transporter ATP-binding protein n=1 Tax=Paenibacillus sp. MMS18-CY102 TaxID=2682849 RepID=UPI0013660755|nr:metal ABC transporter ATP-binding protein [Paenibacillus sp. MMS18-CY102]MWC29241.1 ATP-binding cassette domain-containing protein [Paenibacillus sp. MMS18-CY102]